MADHRKETPDFFKDNPLDPVGLATGYPNRSRTRMKDTPEEMGSKAASLPRCNRFSSHSRRRASQYGAELHQLANRR